MLTYSGCTLSKVSRSDQFMDLALYIKLRNLHNICATYTNWVIIVQDLYTKAFLSFHKPCKS